FGWHDACVCRRRHRRLRARHRPYFSSLFFYCSRDHRALHSFPTRRSSDLARPKPPLPDRWNWPCPVWPSSYKNESRADEKHFHRDRKSTRLNSSHVKISYAVFCLKKKKKKSDTQTTPQISEKRESSQATKR